MSGRAGFGFIGRMKTNATNDRIGWAVGWAMVLAAVLVGCVTNEAGRKQLMLVSSGEMTQLGLSSFDQMKKETPISKDPAANQLVRSVGERIRSVVNLPGAQWEFVVFESPEANAFCLPGGKVGVYTGILPITQTEEGLATVIGHEVAHAVARHGGERMSEGAALQAVGILGGAAMSKTKYGELFNQAYAPASQIAVALPHSREQESEADHMGLIYMARAGYRPEAAVEFWQRFSDFNKRAGSQTPWFLRTHPMDETRILQLQRWMPEARAQLKTP